VSAEGDAEGGTSRAAFRAFVRAHHPDVGGDPDEFIAGVEQFRTQAETPDTADDGRYDAPVSFVVSPKGVARARQWRRRRRRPPRVT
jgi:hypothetical protein